MHRCQQEYGHLRTLIPNVDENTRTNPALSQVREHAVNLARRAIMDDMRHLHDHQDQMEPFQARQVREGLHLRLRRLVPGTTVTIKAMRINEQEVSTRSDHIATALVDHWRTVFGDKPIDREELAAWLQQVLPPSGTVPKGPSRWKITRTDVERAVRCSGNSLPGPDRIPYAAWRTLGEVAIDVLHGAAQAMATHTFSDDIRAAYGCGPHSSHPFNLGIMVCIPKRPSDHDPHLGDVYRPQDTRPLCIVDTANRILANAYRYR